MCVQIWILFLAHTQGTSHYVCIAQVGDVWNRGDCSAKYIFILSVSFWSPVLECHMAGLPICLVRMSCRTFALPEWICPAIRIACQQHPLGKLLLAEQALQLTPAASVQLLKTEFKLRKQIDRGIEGICLAVLYFANIFYGLLLDSHRLGVTNSKLDNQSKRTL